MKHNKSPWLPKSHGLLLCLSILLHLFVKVIILCSSKRIIRFNMDENDAMRFHLLDFAFDFFCNPMAFHNIEVRGDTDRQIDEHDIAVVASFKVTQCYDARNSSDQHRQGLHFIFVKAIRQCNDRLFEDVQCRLDDNQANDESSNDIEDGCSEDCTDDPNSGTDTDQCI